MAKIWAKKFYNSKAWRTAREQALRRDCYTCKDCEGRATEVHHIIELTPSNIHDNNIALNLDNLESLCHNCHNKRTQKESETREGYYFDDNGIVQKYK